MQIYEYEYNYARTNVGITLANVTRCITRHCFLFQFRALPWNLTATFRRLAVVDEATTTTTSGRSIFFRTTAMKAAMLAGRRWWFVSVECDDNRTAAGAGTHQRRQIAAVEHYGTAAAGRTHALLNRRNSRRFGLPRQTELGQTLAERSTLTRDQTLGVYWPMCGFSMLATDWYIAAQRSIEHRNCRGAPPNICWYRRLNGVNIWTNLPWRRTTLERRMCRTSRTIRY